MMFELMPGFYDRNRFFTNWLEPFENAKANHFCTDVTESENHYTLSADLPGYKPEEIDISVQGDELVIEAKHEESKEEKKENYLRRERSFGSVRRSFSLVGIDQEGITAQFEHGVLQLTLPKLQPKAPEPKRIEIR